MSNYIVELAFSHHIRNESYSYGMSSMINVCICMSIMKVI